MLWRSFHPPHKLWKLRLACHREWQKAITFAMVTVAICILRRKCLCIELLNLPHEADLKQCYNPLSLNGKFMTFTSGPSVNIHYVAYIMGEMLWRACA